MTMMTDGAGPKLLGVDVTWAVTIVAGGIAALVLVVLWNALTVHDPMSRRVKALAERR